MASKIEKASRQQRTCQDLQNLYVLAQVLVLMWPYYRQATQESSQDCPRDGEDEGGVEGQEEEVRRCLLLVAMESGGYGNYDSGTAWHLDVAASSGA